MGARKLCINVPAIQGSAQSDHSIRSARLKKAQQASISNAFVASERNDHMKKEKNGSIAASVFWMFLISILLFWLPVVGPFLAGLVGGKKSGGVGNAVTAVFLPGVVFAVLLFALASSLSGMPLLGTVAGAGGFALSLVHVGPLLLGAIIGGLIA